MARKLIDEGAIGQVRTARARFLLDYNSNPDVPMSWRFDRARAGSGALGDVGSHCIDLLQYLAGPITAVAARMQTFVDRAPRADGRPVDVTVDDQTEILADFESGATGTILASWAGTGHKCDLGFEVIGRAGRSPSAGSVPTNCSSSMEATRSTGRAFARSWSVRRIPAPTASTRSPPRASATPTPSRSRPATRCATWLPARSCRARRSSTGLRVAEVSDAVIAAVATGRRWQ